MSHLFTRVRPSRLLIAPRTEVAQFFEPSIQSIASTVRSQRVAATEPVNVSLTFPIGYDIMLMRSPSWRFSSAASRPAPGFLRV